MGYILIILITVINRMNELLILLVNQMLNMYFISMYNQWSTKDVMIAIHIFEGCANL